MIEAADGNVLEAGTVYLAPGGLQMGIERTSTGRLVVYTKDDPQENFCKPAADYLFRSLAKSSPGSVLGVIMTGMGSDGTKGLGA